MDRVGDYQPAKKRTSDQKFLPEQLQSSSRINDCFFTPLTECWAHFWTQLAYFEVIWTAFDAA